jgi:circadian clock protein KaiB
MSQSKKFHFRLYIAGDGPNSVRALANLRTLCQTHLAGRHRIEVFDILLQPERALEDDVLLTPTLMKLAPNPVQKIIGNLNDTAIVLEAIGLAP